MDSFKNLLPFCKKGKGEEKKYLCFLKNGSSLVEDLIVSFRGKYKLPIPCFSAEELVEATKNFSERFVAYNYQGAMFKGTLKEREVIVIGFKVHEQAWPFSEWTHERLIKDIVITSQMSHLKNVLQLIGCCLEMTYPALVYAYAGTKLLSSLLQHPNDHELLPWRSRLKIASDIATVILRLHTDFPTPIIYKDLTPKTVIIDQCGVAKLFDFGSSISLPPGELKVEDDRIYGTVGYMDPEYEMSGDVTQKTDVYSFGVFMLALFTGDPWWMNKDFEVDGKCIHLIDRRNAEVDVEYIYLIDLVRGGNLQKDHLNQIVDPNISKAQISSAQWQQMLAFVHLALRCIEFKGDDRPDMIDVAKELRKIEKICAPS